MSTAALHVDICLHAYSGLMGTVAFIQHTHLLTYIVAHMHTIAFMKTVASENTELLEPA